MFVYVLINKMILRYPHLSICLQVLLLLLLLLLLCSSYRSSSSSQLSFVIEWSLE